MCTLCDSTNINTIIEFVPNFVAWNELDYRVDLCIIAKGAGLEHL